VSVVGVMCGVVVRECVCVLVWWCVCVSGWLVSDVEVVVFVVGGEGG
jgi:hypothetical protein